MPLVRFIVSVRATQATPVRDAVVNTLYFNVSVPATPGGAQDLVDDLFDIWKTKYWATGRWIDIRAYNMDDAKPRPVLAEKQALATGTINTGGPPQIALCLSYYADRNLPRHRGRIYLGPWGANDTRPNGAVMQLALDLAGELADLGGVDVDWSLYSPTLDEHTRISHAWVDNAWDVIRSRRLPGTQRVEMSLDG